MTFNILAVQELGASPSGLHPVADTRPELFEREPLDGERADWLVATALNTRIGIPDRSPKLIEARKIRADIAITDQRVVVVCEKYDKGGGWGSLGGGLGAAVVTVGLNAASRAAASKRSRDRVLAGHVRHQWLHSVGYFSRSGLIRVEFIRLCIFDGTENPARPLWLELELPKDVSSQKVAERIVSAAADFWKVLNVVPAEHRAAVEALPASSPPVTRSGGDDWRTYTFPFCMRAQPDTAFAGATLDDMPTGGPS